MNTTQVAAQPDRKKCSTCKVFKDRSHFAGRTNAYATCASCRDKRTRREVIPLLRMVFLDELHEAYPGRDEAERADVNDEDDEHFDLWYQDYICIDAGLETYSDTDLIDRVLEEIQRCDGYRYITKNVGDPIKKSDIQFTAYCAQPRELQQQVSEESRRRLYTRMTSYSCGGCVSGKIDRRNMAVHILIRHKQQHQRPDEEDLGQRNAVPVGLREFIASQTRRGAEAPEMYE